jgi:hypothetical protein
VHDGDSKEVGGELGLNVQKRGCWMLGDRCWGRWAVARESPGAGWDSGLGWEYPWGSITHPQPLRCADIGFDVVRRTIVAGPRPDIISLCEGEGSQSKGRPRWPATGAARDARTKAAPTDEPCAPAVGDRGEMSSRVASHRFALLVDS